MKVQDRGIKLCKHKIINHLVVDFTSELEDVTPHRGQHIRCIGLVARRERVHNASDRFVGCCPV